MRESGFTLLELLVAMAIIAILSAIAIPGFSLYRKNAGDAAAKSDLRNAMLAISAAINLGDELPPTAESLAQYGHRLSNGVSFTQYSPGAKNGQPSVHMHVRYEASPNAWHAHYPADGANIEIR